MGKLRFALPLRLPSGLPVWFGALMRMPLALSVALAIGVGLGFSVIVVLSVGETEQQVAAIHPLERLVPSGDTYVVAELPDDQQVGRPTPLAHGDSTHAAPYDAQKSQDGAANAEPQKDRHAPSPQGKRERLMGVDGTGAMPPSLADSEQIPKDGTIGVFRAILEPDDGRPQVAILLRDVGLDPSLAEQSVALPDAIMIGMSPYIAHGPSWHTYMHREGHETALMLPVTEEGTSGADMGPLALVSMTTNGVEFEGLDRILDRATGFAAVAAPANGFAAAPERFAPIAERLAASGIGFIEIDGEELAVPAQTAGLAYASATIALDDQLEPVEIDRKLQRLALVAKRSGRAIAHTSPYPIVLDRIWNWANELDDQSPALVPVGQLLKQQPAAG